MNVFSIGWRLIAGATRRFLKIDGELRAASFAYYAFFSLFALLPLLLFLSGTFAAGDKALPERVATLIRNYIPLEPGDEQPIRDVISGVIENRAKAGVAGVACLLWASLRFFHALIVGVNRAWGSRNYGWGSLNIKNLAMLGILASALLLGVLVPPVLDALHAFVRVQGGWTGWVYKAGRGLVPSIVLLYGFVMFYKFAPRHKVRWAEVWLPAILVTVLLQAVQRVFVVYAYQLAHFNAVFGALGGVLILLMWIYLSGIIIIFGGCLCASGAEVGTLLRRARRKTQAGKFRPAGTDPSRDSP